MHLLYRQEWRDAHGPDMIALLTPLLDSRDPVHRYLASHALPVMLPRPDDLTNELDRRLRSEDDQRIAAFLMNLLARSAPAQPDRADQVLEHLADSPQWAILTTSPDGDHECGPTNPDNVAVDLMTALAALNDTPARLSGTGPARP